MNAPNTRQFINTEKPAGLQANYNDAFPVHKEVTAPNPVVNPIVPKQWREQLPTPAYAQEPLGPKWPSPYTLIGYAFAAFFFVVGVAEMGFSMWHAFLQAIR